MYVVVVFPDNILFLFVYGDREAPCEMGPSMIDQCISTAEIIIYVGQSVRERFSSS